MRSRRAAPRRKASARSYKSRTILFHELPHWAQDNEWIVGGYRRIQNHWWGCFKSVFGYLHNETVNIHTHLGGALLFGYFLATLHNVELKEFPTTWMDSFMLVVFLSSAIFCLMTSATFHTASCHSQKVAGRCLTMDYAGIVILTVGSFYPAVHFGFYCHPHEKLFYLTLLTSVGIFAAYIVLNPVYAQPTHRGARTAVFIGLGLAGVVPTVHCILREGISRVLVEYGLRWILLSAALYIGGGALYANRIPERFSPGRFDYFFASHQIFHVCVLVAVCLHYHGVFTSLRYTYSQPDICAA
ncbi:Hemolysin-III channel protein Izh2 [Mycena chlorophos]|uniref:Hemolysin-III channel protein Izh2 n=1 Tax=Mycena chlorophos TaxID=658473 RepID=A0A8H6SHY9_MYCCL|nr:Hemolysin-III channel protein Izh2 [Mycena chlorophos]